MNKECLRCGEPMKEVKQANSPSLIIEKKEEEFKNYSEKRSGVNFLVCPECGYLELETKKRKIFK